MGVSLDLIKGRDFKEYLYELYSREIEFSQYVWIEEGIAGALYHKDLSLLNEYVKLFYKCKKVFKKQAEEYKANL